MARVRRETGIDPQIAIVFTTAPPSCSSLYYVSVANDARGIGYQHEDPREVFDDSPDSRLEGIAFMNDLPYWQEHPAEFARAFDHELGHRFGARVHVQREGVPVDALLGRQGLHWSYFADTGGSPLEGNRWAPVAVDRWSAETPLGPGRFSDFDLYLMGVRRAEHVAPLQLVRPAVESQRDCFGRVPSAASPPQSCGGLEVAGSAVPVTLDAVIAAEGPRLPAADAAPKTLDVALIVIESDSSALDASACRVLSADFAERVRQFGEATGGMLSLRNLTDFGARCEDWPTRSDAAHTHVSEGCHFSGARRAPAWPLAFLMLAVSLCRRRATHPRL
jgi:hypothetical protein